MWNALIDKIKEPKKIVCQQTFAKYLKQGGIRKKLLRLHFQTQGVILNYCNTYCVKIKKILGTYSRIEIRWTIKAQTKTH